MSAEVPTPEPPRPALAITNRGQVLLFALLTVILTAVTVWGGKAVLKQSETLTFVVGAPDGDEARFAARLASVLKNTSSRFRLKIVTGPDNVKALTRFERREADLALVRTDAKIPPRARALAVIEHDLALLISPGNKKIKSLAELKKKKIAILADGEANAAFVRNMLEAVDASDAASRAQTAPPGATPDKLFSSGFGAVVAVFHASTPVRDKSFAQYARQGKFTLNAIDQAKALARKIPGISEETIEAGMISTAPEIPDDDVDTIGLQWILVAQAQMSSTTAGGLADGTYSGSTAQTRYGGVQVVVTVSGGSITSVDVPVVPDANRTDQSISAQAVPMLVDETMSAQSAQIHLISGATYTSQGYVQSLQSALDQASR